MEQMWKMKGGRPQQRKMMTKTRDAWTCPWPFYIEEWTQRAK
jgi:hypothetical protein